MGEMVPKANSIRSIAKISKFLGYSPSWTRKLIENKGLPAKRVSHRQAHPFVAFEQDLIEWKEAYDSRARCIKYKKKWTRVPFTKRWKRACNYVIHKEFGGSKNKFATASGIKICRLIRLLSGKVEDMTVRDSKFLLSLMGDAYAKSLAGDDLVITKKLTLSQRYNKAVKDLNRARITHKETAKQNIVAARNEKRLTKLVAELLEEKNHHK